MTQQTRKPRLLIAGEFSSGKTQLITGLLQEEILPSNVTSTSLPPMWIKNDAAESSMVDLMGNRHPLPDLDDVSVSKTAFCEMQHDAEFLNHFEIIDTPGNSDPNIPPESWMRMLNCADVILWCTNATQAWRQSEKAVWLDMKPELCENATILITHGDRVIDERSQERLARRVRRDSQDFFDYQMLVSLIDEDHIQNISNHLIGLSSTLELTGVDEPEFETKARGNNDIKVRKIQVRKPAAETLATPAEPADALVGGTQDRPAEKPGRLVLDASMSAENAVKPAETVTAAIDTSNDVDSAADSDVSAESSKRVMDVLKLEENILPFSKPANDGSSRASVMWASLIEGKDMTDIENWKESVTSLLGQVDKLLDEKRSAGALELNASASE